MSLDFYLTPPQSAELNKAAALLHSNGMAFAAKILDRYEAEGDSWNRNITHNLGQMAVAAGIYRHLWRPEEIGITVAKDLVEPLTKGLADLEARSDFFRGFDAENGWGRYADFVGFVRDVLQACKDRPDHLVRACR